MMNNFLCQVNLESKRMLTKEKSTLRVITGRKNIGAEVKVIQTFYLFAGRSITSYSEINSKFACTVLAIAFKGQESDEQ